MLFTSVEKKMTVVFITIILKQKHFYCHSSNKGLIYPYTFLYIIIILTDRKIYFHSNTIGKNKSIMKNSTFSLVA